MGSYHEVSDTIDGLIGKLNKLKKELGGDTTVQFSEPRLLLIPFERDEVGNGLLLNAEKGKVVISQR